MNFSEQLDQFVERGAEKYSQQQMGNANEYMRIACGLDHKAGAASLKPIVLKLAYALEKIANEDFRGNRSSGSTQAHYALMEIKEILNAK